MKKIKTKPIWQSVIIGLIISTLITLGFDYLFPSPWNIHAGGTWFKLFFLLLVYCTINAVTVFLIEKLVQLKTSLHLMYQMNMYS